MARRLVWIHSCFSLLQLLLLLVSRSTALSSSTSSDPSRRDLVCRVGLGVGNTLRWIARGIEYPPEHEQRVARTIQDALVQAAASASVGSRASTARKIRVLEVGIGPDCRLIRRGLYDDAFDELAKMGISQVELVGIDLKKPKDDAIQQAKEYLSRIHSPLQVQFTAMEGDILQPLPNDATLFDSAISCLTLCSVVDQEVAVTRIRDAIQPRGGTLGYIEHVAVNPTEPYKFIEWQQQLLDPLQQALVDNCHLHRYTEDTITSVFGVDQRRARIITEERFLVDSMWPVACQACGVLQRIS
jgi:SAM-dependent methyltransferase